MAQVINKSKAAKAAVKHPRKKTGKTGVGRKDRQQARKIIEDLHEAEQVHQGKRKGKAFDEFLQEL